MPRPLFISLDGLDGTGKTTQCRLLVEWLCKLNLPVTACADPGGTPLGEKLRELLLFGREHGITLRAEAMLFMASRSQLVSEVIMPALDRGEVVISDRFLISNVVYQGHAGGLDPDELWTVGRIATAGLEPDLTLILDLPIEEALARKARGSGALDRMESRDLEFHRAVKRGFLFEAGRRPVKYRIIDASADLQTVQASLRREIRRLLVSHDWVVESGN